MEQAWSDRYRQLRQFINTDYELWNEDAPVSTFHYLLNHVTCTTYDLDGLSEDQDPAPAEGEEPGEDDEQPPEEGEGDAPADEEVPPEVADPADCQTHDYFRQQFALYLLYTKYVIDQDWLDFPGLDEDQQGELFATYKALIQDSAQPSGLKQTIINAGPCERMV